MEDVIGSDVGIRFFGPPCITCRMKDPCDVGLYLLVPPIADISARFVLLDDVNFVLRVPVLDDVLLYLLVFSV